jgi:hypothetical protein
MKDFCNFLATTACCVSKNYVQRFSGWKGIMLHIEAWWLQVRFCSHTDLISTADQGIFSWMTSIKFTIVIQCHFYLTSLQNWMNLTRSLKAETITAMDIMSLCCRDFTHLWFTMPSVLRTGSHQVMAQSGRQVISWELRWNVKCDFLISSHCNLWCLNVTPSSPNGCQRNL